MNEAAVGYPESPNIVTLIAKKVPGTPVAHFLLTWENALFSLLVVGCLCVVALAANRSLSCIPGRRQNFMEMIFGGIDDFVCGILGPQGRKHTPFLGTLFLYILGMNCIGLVPLMKSATSSMYVTFALALCVFFYVQFFAVRELGLGRYLRHLSGDLSGGLALSIILPLFLFFVHLTSELIKPVSLSLRLRSNILADDILLAALSAFGFKGLPLFVFSYCLVIISSIVQAVIFCLLSTVYLAIFLGDEHHQAA